MKTEINVHTDIEARMYRAGYIATRIIQWTHNTRRYTVYAEKADGSRAPANPDKRLRTVGLLCCGVGWDARGRHSIDVIVLE